VGKGYERSCQSLRQTPIYISETVRDGGLIPRDHR